MKFKFIANAEFDADDLDDALTKLAQHFLSLSYDTETAVTFTEGSVSVSRKQQMDLLD